MRFTFKSSALLLNNRVVDCQTPADLAAAEHTYCEELRQIGYEEYTLEWPGRDGSTMTCKRRVDGDNPASVEQLFEA